MADVSPELLARARAYGKQSRPPDKIMRMRHAIAFFTDPGVLTDDEVKLVYANYRAGLDEPEIIEEP